MNSKLKKLLWAVNESESPHEGTYDTEFGEVIVSRLGTGEYELRFVGDDLMGTVKIITGLEDKFDEQEITFKFGISPGATLEIFEILKSYAESLRPHEENRSAIYPNLLV